MYENSQLKKLIDIILGKLRVPENIGYMLLQCDYNSVHPC